MNLKIQIIDKSLGSPLPVYSSENASGMDLASASPEPIVLEPMETKLIPTNIKVEIPPGFEGQVRPRSGLAIKHNIGIINSPGTIDADYRGEIKILLTNFGKNSYTVKFGDRIAQFVVCKIEKVTISVEETLSETKRGQSGFGHTGIK